MRTVLVVDDEPAVGASLARGLRHPRLRWLHATTAEEGLRMFAERRPDLVVLDMGLPTTGQEGRHAKPPIDPEGGLKLLPELLAREPDANVVMLSGLKVGRKAFMAMREGALDYFTKNHGPDLEELERLVGRLVAGRPLAQRRRLPVPASPCAHRDTPLNRLRGSSPLLDAVRKRIRQLAPNGCPVLVRGETGTGKDVVAQLLHELSGRRGPLVRVNCAAIPAELLESELFGHEAGSFTGASMQRKGALEIAAGGTLLLDEIADLPLHQQAKLLCALETPFRRVGGQEPIRFTGRLVSATHHDLLADVRSGRFRADLFYRVAGAPVEMPPLRAHQEDIAELAAWILDNIAFGLPLSMAALRALERHPWPGNVRELQHVLEAAAVLDEDGTVGIGDLTALRHAPKFEDAHVGAAILELEGSGSKFMRAQRAAAESAVQRTGGNVSQAARLLGIDRKTLTRLLPPAVQRKGEADR